MKIHILAGFMLLLLASCQSGRGSQPAIPVAPPLTSVQVGAATPTYNIVTLVVPTQPPIETRTELEIGPKMAPPPSPTTDPGVDRPLIIPRILKAEFTPQAIRLQVGFDIHPAYRGKPGVFGEIYDAKLSDQTGREIAGISTEMTKPEMATLEFSPLPAGVKSLILGAQLVLHGVPAAAPLVIDVSGHPLDQAWPIQTRVRFGDLEVQLHTARLFQEESGALSEAKKQLSLELLGENAELDGAQLFCLLLSPLPPPIEGSMGCGQEPSGISATVSLGPAVDRNATLPFPTSPVTLQAAADFLLPGSWETSWTVEK